MIRSFCVGALVGFVFGSSKQGMQMRESIDGFITSLISNDEELKFDKREDGKKSAAKSFKDGRSGSAGHNGHNGGNGKRSREFGAARETASEKGKSASAIAEPLEDTRQAKAKADATAGGVGVPLDKAQELADALNAKPTAPETDELSPS